MNKEREEFEKLNEEEKRNKIFQLYRNAGVI